MGAPKGNGMSVALEDLDERFKPFAVRLLAEAAYQGIELAVICTRRTEQEHAANVAKGVSWVKRSKHCDGLAIDVCPIRLLREKFWAPASPLWEELGDLGEILGMRWGGRWRQRDLGHFEYIAKRETKRA